MKKISRMLAGLILTGLAGWASAQPAPSLAKDSAAPESTPAALAGLRLQEILEVFWPVLLTAATLIAGVVAFGISVVKLRNVQLENIKLREELSRLKYDREEREKLIIRPSLEDLEKYSRWVRPILRSNQPHQSIVAIGMLAIGFVISSLLVNNVRVTGEKHGAALASAQLTDVLQLNDRSERELKTTVADLQNKLAEANRQLELGKQYVGPRPPDTTQNCKDAETRLRLEFAQGIQPGIPQTQECAGTCHVRIVHGLVSSQIAGHPEWNTINHVQFGQLSCPEFDMSAKGLTVPVPRTR